MLANMFSIFDPFNFSYFALNWVSIMVPALFFLNFNFWLSSTSSFKNNIKLNWSNLVMNTKMALTMMPKSPFNLVMPTIIFFIIIRLNLMGLMPYMFTPTSHMSLSASIALPCWLSAMMYGWSNKPYKMLAHMVPQGTPYILMPFMVLIETISLLIQPLTLSVRLAANMIAGHLILATLASIYTNTIYINKMFIMVPHMLLLMLEIAVAMIQAYVFMTLLILYLTEAE